MSKEKRGIREYATVGLKGLAMGAADVVPGVSGGTIAFISGIYEELLTSIKSIDFTALKLLFTGKLKEFWKKINGTFLLSLVTGIAISIFSLANLATYLLENEPIAIWAFFFGLIIASCLIVSRDISKWRLGTVALLLLGGAFGYMITVISPGETPNTWWFIMLSGAIAICAMILPGTSGAFILLLMGKYQFLMNAVQELNIPVIALFIVGAIIGVICFSHFLTWLLKNYHNSTIALLIGVMMGSLNKIWPWKISEVLDVEGGEFVQETNVLPATYETVVGNPEILTAIITAIVGLTIIFVIEAIGKHKAKLTKQREA